MPYSILRQTIFNVLLNYQNSYNSFSCYCVANLCIIGKDLQVQILSLHWWVMGHFLGGSVGHGSQAVTHCLLCTGALWLEEQQTRNWPNCTTIMKAITKTTITFVEPKKVEKHDKNVFLGALNRTCAPPIFKFVPTPLVLRLSFRQVRETTVTSSYRVFSRTWNPRTHARIKQLKLLKIVHFRDTFLFGTKKHSY